MNSLFRDDCDYETKIAESGAADWLVGEWDHIEEMFEDINARAPTAVIITTRSTLKTHEQHLQKAFDHTGIVSERLNSYTHHSGDYFPEKAKYPFLTLQDPNITGGISQESSQFTALAEETRDSVFYVVFQTTRGEGRIEKYENVYWFTLPRILLLNGVNFEANRIGEIGALTLFGETRARGFLSMLWLNFRYEDISNIDNVHFANIIRESVVAPFYLSQAISSYPVFMGYYYSPRDESLSKRNLETKLKKLKNKPRITRSSSKDNNSDNIDESPETELEEPAGESEEILEETIHLEPEEEEPEEVEEPEEEEQPLILRPPSPQRAKIRSIESPKRKPVRRKKAKRPPKPKKKTQKGGQQKKNYSNKKPKPGMVINPQTGRNVKIGSKRYDELVQAGVLEPV